MGVRLVATFAVVALVVAACGGGGGGTVAPPRAIQVEAMGLAFVPRTLEVAAGVTIALKNRDGVAHTFTSGPRGAPTGDFDEEVDGFKESTMTIDTPGTYEFHCRFHSQMKGVIEVK